MRKLFLLTTLSFFNQADVLANPEVCHDVRIDEIQVKPDRTTYRVARSGYVCYNRTGSDCTKAIPENQIAVFSPTPSYSNEQLDHLFGAASLGYVTSKRLYVCYDSNNVLYRAYLTSRPI